MTGSAISLTLNGVAHDSSAPDLMALWREHAAAREIAEPRGFAIALNGAVVRRAQWAQTPLTSGDRVEIVRAFAGG